MEYLLVVFSENRGVLLDGLMIGPTNQILEVEAGLHSITLDDPQDFTPESYIISIDGTTEISPKEIAFMKKIEQGAVDTLVVDM